MKNEFNFYTFKILYYILNFQLIKISKFILFIFSVRGKKKNFYLKLIGVIVIYIN